MSIDILDPTHEAGCGRFVPAARLPTLQGTTIAILSNGKKNAQPFFDAFAYELVERYGVAKVVRLTKSNYSAPAEPGLLNEVEKWHALIAGVGD